jgi:alkanesulfonate monooxygenase SsuD/methylene tetrahydromethanopterin reductase-like flavin-dependent oxidoreductase (luciferase family)
MRLGIGLPNHVEGVDGPTLLAVARRAEELGFASVYVNDRLVWTSHEPLTLLAAIAGATTRIGLTGVLVAPLRTDHALFASAAASVDSVAGAGRLALALAPGVRAEDFERAGVPFTGRGAALDALLAELGRCWGPAGDVGPRPATPGGPALLFAGTSAPTLRRIVTHGRGWLANPGLDRFAAFSTTLRHRWEQEGRDGEPYRGTVAPFALGAAAVATMERTQRAFFAATPDHAGPVIAGTATSPAAVRELVDAYAAAGADELILQAQHPDPAQVNRVADALGAVSVGG